MRFRAIVAGRELGSDVAVTRLLARKPTAAGRRPCAAAGSRQPPLGVYAALAARRALTRATVAAVHTAATATWRVRSPSQSAPRSRGHGHKRLRPYRGSAQLLTAPLSGGKGALGPFADHADLKLATLAASPSYQSFSIPVSRFASSTCHRSKAQLGGSPSNNWRIASERPAGWQDSLRISARSFPCALGRAEARRRDHVFDMDGRQPATAHCLHRPPRGQAGRPSAARSRAKLRRERSSA